jgi:hypothetical protein
MRYDNDVKFLYQPTWPNGDAWASVEEAESWAQQHLLSASDPTAELPGPSPELPTVPRPARLYPDVVIPGVSQEFTE